MLKKFLSDFITNIEKDQILSEVEANNILSATDEEKESRIAIAKNYYGNFFEKHSSLLSRYVNNPITLKYGYIEYEDIKSLAKNVSEFLTQKESLNSNIFIQGEETFLRKYLLAMTSYMGEAVAADDALIVYDYTKLGFANEGFVLTKDKLYIHSVLENLKTISLNEIISIKNNFVDDIMINNTIRVTGAKKYIGIALEYAICNLIRINENLKKEN